MNAMSLYKSKTYLNDIKIAVTSIVNADRLNSTKILITGAGGIIGSAIVDCLIMLTELSGFNIEIYALGRSKDRLEKRFCNYSMCDYIHLIEHDVCNRLDLDETIDLVIHTAGNAYPSAFDKYPVDTIMTNIYGTYNLLECCKKWNTKRFLFVSSGEVYGGSVDTVPVNEEYGSYIDSMNARSCYPNSKRTAESLCVSYSKQYGIDTVVVRPCHIYGAGFTSLDNRASAQFIRAGAERNTVTLKSRGEQIRSFCYVADAASAIISVLINSKPNTAYNISNMNSVASVFEFAQMCAKIGGSELIVGEPTQDEIRQRSIIKNQILDNTRLTALGWNPKYNLENGIKNSITIIREVNEYEEKQN